MDELPTIVEAIIANPQSGEPLLKSWEGFRRVGFGNRPQVRIIFKYYECCTEALKETGECRFGPDEGITINECQGQIDFVFLRTREDCNTHAKRSYANLEFKKQYYKFSSPVGAKYL